MRQTPGRLVFLDVQASVLASVPVRVGGEAEGSWGYTMGEFGRDVWVSSGDVIPLSHGFLVGVVSAPVRSVWLGSWGCVKSALGVETLQALC